ncbi:hypothetical protein EIN_311760 [Entamoeba invadens IP1]|uniref:Uncharacterized protein n=1 Tax=Entamoeba invadens IP1 TaxID=370355 RepID=A0A0A1TZF8_ENTIV|nr:hypothetical protein EIN_311760 [Entamoeba invadens IP1]ELP83915.1 hypothetical protein EIN_311760 [Entamoeba invadens IP1]|eukprot:XP_004183261.1 hypothetical protein EIN_311760 [Entamoeba invadens IP1]
MATLFHFIEFLVVSLFSTMFFFLVSSPYYTTLRYTYNDLVNGTHKTQYRNKHIDVNTFNYSGVCGKVFTSPPNGPDDYIISSYDMMMQCVKKQMWETLSMARTAMPRAQMVLLLFHFPPIWCIGDMERFKQLNITTIKVQRRILEQSVAIRYVIFHKYITENVNKINRIILMDPRDVVFFEDFFRTFSTDDVGWLAECTGSINKNECYSPATYRPHAEWLNDYFSKEIRDDFVKRRLPSINGGFGYGGAHKIKQVLDIYIENMNPKYMVWGYDQALLNVLYYHGKFNSTGLKLVKCEQKLCYIGRSSFKLIEKKVVYVDKDNLGCSPVASHKFELYYDERWRIK